MSLTVLLKCLPCSLRRALRPLPNLLSDLEQVISPPWGLRVLVDTMKILYLFSRQGNSSYEILWYYVNSTRYSEIRCQHLLIAGRRNVGRDPSLPSLGFPGGKPGVGEPPTSTRSRWSGGRASWALAWAGNGKMLLSVMALSGSRKERKYQWWSHG